MTFPATSSQSEKFIPAKPLNELSYDYLLFLSSPDFLPIEYSYYVCEYVRHERYLDIYNQLHLGHREILTKIDEEIEEIRKALYEYLYGTKTNYVRTYGIGQELIVMNYLESNLTGGAKEMIEKLEQARYNRKKELVREQEKEQEEKQKSEVEEYNKTWRRLKDLSFTAEAKYIYQHSNLDGIKQEWLDEVKRLFKVIGKDTSDENIIFEMTYLVENID